MAALDPRALQRFSTNIVGGAKIHWFTYATNDTLAEVTTDGYFNSVRDALSKGSMIYAVVDVDGTQNHVQLRVTTWAKTGNIVTAIDTPAA